MVEAGKIWAFCAVFAPRTQTSVEPRNGEKLKSTAGFSHCEGPVLTFVLGLMAALGDDVQRTGSAYAYAQSIAWVVSHEDPPPGISRELGAALLVIYGWEEGRFVMKPRRGDNGVAVCSFQVHARSPTQATMLETNPVECVHAAYAVMRASQQMCGDLSGYCGACRGRFPAELALRRAHAAEAILAKAPPLTAAERPKERPTKRAKR